VPATSTSAAEPEPTPIPTGPTALFGRGQVLDNTYRIVDVLAAGGMGEVYVAVHLRLPRKLAIKTLQPEFAARQEWVARFCREACVLAQLHHPNIVQVIDFNVTPNGVPYIAMELIDGVDLRAELDRGRRFEVTEIVSIVRQVASALDAAHAAGVVHRDLKPENVVLSPVAGQLPVVKVIDFGVSLCDWSERVTGDCSVFGTPDYMAPEQAQGLRDQTDARTDQFALAAVTYTLLSGRAPFARETPVAILYAVVHEEPAALGTALGWDPAPVERVLRKGMARERDDRYPSVLAFAEALEESFIEGGALPRPTPPAPLMLVTDGARAPSTGRAARRPRGGAVKRGIPMSISMLLASLLIAGALWRGLGAARTPQGEQRALRVDVGAVQAAATKEFQHLKGMLEQRNANGSQGEQP
jgi:serine/threonine protein kinase